MSKRGPTPKKVWAEIHRLYDLGLSEHQMIQALQCEPQIVRRVVSSLTDYGAQQTGPMCKVCNEVYYYPTDFNGRVLECCRCRCGPLGGRAA